MCCLEVTVCFSSAIDGQSVSEVIVKEKVKEKVRLGQGLETFL
jgi:hypothetical protein